MRGQEIEMSSKRGGDVEKTKAGKHTEAEDAGGGQLTPKQAAFVREYLIDYNGVQAAIRAGYAERSAAEQSYDLLRRPHIKELVVRKQAAAADAAQVDAALVISELYQVATADPRELVSVEIDCCRNCWGISGLRMWTAGEYKKALNEAMRDGLPAPDFEGGFRFDPRKDPNPECPECHGRGVERVTVTPSAKLSRSATRLLSSIRQTKDGIEIKMHDKMAALLALGKITGVLRDRTELTGAGGGPLQLQPVRPPHELTNEELVQALRDAGHPMIEGLTNKLLGEPK
jgi:phage terminase small subunit